MEIIKLEKKSGEETERLWMERIKNTIQWRKKRHFGDDMMQNSVDLFQGRHWGFDVENDDFDLNSENPNDRITVNLVGSTVQDFIPFLVRTLPKFELQPTSPEAVPSSKSASAYMNWCWREYGMQKQYRRAVQDGLVTVRGIIKTGYNFELEATEDKTGKVLYNDNIRKDAPFISRVDPRRFYFEPTASQFDLESARWAFEVLFQTWQDVVSNPEYSAAVRGRIRSGRENPETIADYLTSQGQSLNDVEHLSDVTQSQQLLVLYEVWDKKYEKYWLFAGNVEKPLLEKADPYPYLDGFPYKEWRYQELNDEPMGMSVPQVMKDQQHELNRIRTTEFNHRRKYGSRKWQIIDEGVDESEIDKMLDADSEYFYTRHEGAAKPHDSPPLPPDNYQIDSVIQNDIRQLTGQDELQRGGSLPSRTSAREIQARQSIMGTKTSGRTALVDEFLNGVGRQVLQHIQANMETKRVIRVTGDPSPEGNAWLEVTPDDIRHEFDLTFESTSKSEETPEQDKAARANLFERATQAAPFMAQQGMQVNLAELFKWTLEPYKRNVELDRFFIEAPPPAPEPPVGGGNTAPGNPDAQGAQVAAGSVNPNSEVR